MKKTLYMKRAIQLSKLGEFTTAPNPNVGCVIVNNDHIVGEGWHKKYGDNHAEVNALNMAGKKAKGGTAYITLEPCNHFGKTPPCCDALINAGIVHVIISNLDPNPKVSGKGVIYLKKNNISVEIGLLSKESKKYNKGFFKRMNTGFPWIQLKLAMSIDGRIAMKTGESKWITSQDSRQDVQVFRAKSSAILSTSKTIINDNAQLTVRKEEFNKKILSQFPEKNFKHPIRVIIDSQNRINKSHKIMNTKEKILLIRLKQDDELWPDNVKQIIIKPYKKKINVLSTLKFLGELEINTVWIEAGSKLSGALLKMKLIDEIIIYVAPKILGHEAKPLFFLKNNLKLFECIKFNFLNLKKIGPDIRLILEPQK